MDTRVTNEGEKKNILVLVRCWDKTRCQNSFNVSWCKSLEMLWMGIQDSSKRDFAF